MGIFPRLYDLVMAPWERGRLSQYRRAVMSPASGRVLGVLRRTDAGALAAAIWDAPGALEVERADPIATPAGKVLPYQVLTVVRGAPDR